MHVWNHIGTEKVHLHYMDNDSFFLSFHANNKERPNFLQQNKDKLDFSELHKNHQLYDPINKKVTAKMRIETGPVLVLDNSLVYDQVIYLRL